MGDHVLLEGRLPRELGLADVALERFFFSVYEHVLSEPGELREPRVAEITVEGFLSRVR